MKELITEIKTTPVKFAIVEDGEIISMHTTRIKGSVPVYETDGELEITETCVKMPKPVEEEEI